MTDIEGKRVLEVAVDSKKESVDVLWGCLAKEQRENVEAVSMDFWKPYISGVEKHTPNAAIVHDRFHIMQ